MPKKRTKKSKTAAELRALRHAAGLYYTLQPAAVTLEGMRTEEEFEDLPLSTLESWQRADGWLVKREAHLESLRVRLEKKLGSELVAGRVAQIGRVRKVYDLALDMLEDDNLRPKSWEGVARVFMSLGQNMDALSVAAAQGLAHEERSDDFPSHAIPELTHDEARAAAEAIVRMRGPGALVKRRRLGEGRDAAALVKHG